MIEEFGTFVGQQSRVARTLLALLDGYLEGANITAKAGIT